jgi:uncharacterized protein YaiI (UPF0178 family)
MEKSARDNQRPSIWVDADACPVVIRDILIRAANRTGVQITFVANQHIRLPQYKNLKSVQVSSGFDAADNWIVQQANEADLVITQDIPLADEVITKGAKVIGTRGQIYTKENIKSRLNMRDFMETMRSSGVHSGGPPPLGQQEKQAFANRLDQWLRKAGF